MVEITENKISEEKSSPKEPTIKKKTSRFRITLRIIAGFLVFTALLPLLLYIPTIQRWVTGIAVEKVEAATGYDVEIGQLLIKFPLRIDINDFLVLDERRDTMVCGKTASVNMRLLPLVMGDVVVPHVKAHSVVYQMQSDDKSLTLTAHAAGTQIIDAKFELLTNRLSANHVSLQGGDVSLIIDKRKEIVKPDTASSSSNLLIDVNRIELADIRYRMAMMPTIDSLDVHLPKGKVNDVSINMAVGLIKTGGVDIESLAAVYLYPDTEEAAAFSAQCPTDTISPTPKENAMEWTIMADSLRVVNASARYALSRYSPAEGFDSEYISADKINIAVDNFFNRGRSVKVPIKNISAEERCGIAVNDLSGTFEMNDSAMVIDNIKLHTFLSELAVNARIDNSFFEGKESGKANIDLTSSISLEEIGKALPPAREALRSVSRTTNAELGALISGTGKKLDISSLSLEIPQIVDISANGNISNYANPDKMQGDITINGSLTGGSVLANTINLDKSMRIPAVRLRGKASIDRSELSASLKALVDTSTVVLDGGWNFKGESYRGDIALNGFDIRSFMPGGNIGIVTGRVVAEGQGYDLYTMNTVAAAQVESITIGSDTYYGLMLNAAIDNGDFEAIVSSPNEFAAMDMTLTGTIKPHNYHIDFDGSIDNINLHRLGLYQKPLAARAAIVGNVVLDTRSSVYFCNADITGLNIDWDNDFFRTEEINLDFGSTPEQTSIALKSDDLNLKMHTDGGLDNLSLVATELGNMSGEILKRQRVNIAELKETLPNFTFEASTGSKNIISQFLASSEIEFEGIDLKIEKEQELTFDIDLNKLDYNDVCVDTICFRGETNTDSLLYDIHAGNAPKNTQLFKTADLSGLVSGNRFTAYLQQVNNKGEKGFDLGANVSIADSVVTLKLFPDKPIIALKNWSLNQDNFVSFNLNDNALDADLKVVSADGSSHINIASNDPNDKHNGIIVDMAGIHLKEWLTLSPFAPPIDGTLAANMDLNYNNRFVWGKGLITVNELMYGKNRVGDIGLDTKLAYVSEKQKILAKGDMTLDGANVAKIKGFVADSLKSQYYDLDVDFTRMPLKAANAFIPKSLGSISGYMLSHLDLKGTLSNPDINGYVKFDSTRIALNAYGAMLDLDTVRVPFDSGKLIFNDFDIFGSNSKPICINGTFNLMPFDDMYADLTMKGKNVQLINSRKTSASEVFGKGFVDIDASLVGPINRLDADIDLSILSGSNITYIMQTDVMAVAESSTNNVVKFVNLRDTTKVEDQMLKEEPFAMKINAMLNLQPNAVLAVYISPDGKNRVQIDGQGSFNYVQTYLGDMRMTGRYDIRSGFVRYSPPVLGEKLFNFTEGSNIVWTGDLLNPTIDVKAIDKVKANVTTNENSRLVPFDVILKVGNTLNSLDIKFDLNTEADMAIANEISGMSAEQRSTQAMNLLLYGAYTGAETKTASNLNGENMAYSFLASSLNKWAANNISGVDIKFGVDQYNKTVDGNTSYTTSYSYQVSKSISDKFVISVGGNYSTDASAQDNLAQNLFNDVSFEYKLNKSGTSVFKIFRKTEYESILEGEITEMGGGFVWKRKIASIRDMFRFFKKEKKKTDVAPHSDRKPVKSDNK